MVRYLGTGIQALVGYAQRSTALAITSLTTTVMAPVIRLELQLAMLSNAQLQMRCTRAQFEGE